MTIYADAKKDGRVPLNLWLKKEDAAILDALVSDTDLPKAILVREAIRGLARNLGSMTSDERAWHSLGAPKKRAERTRKSARKTRAKTPRKRAPSAKASRKR